MTLRLHAAPAARALVERHAREAGIAALAGGPGAFDVAVLPHEEAARLVAAGSADSAFCSELGRLRAATAPGEQAIHAVAVAKGAGEEARLLARGLWDARTALGFEGVAIRRAAGSDTVAARELVYGVLAEYGLEPEPDGTDADLGDLAAGFLADGGMFDVALEADGRLAACCGMKVLRDGRLELRKMYVRRDMRGQGLGQRLLDRALAWARGRGFPRVGLETASVLTEAIALYRKAGFTPRPGKPDTCRCDLAFELALG